jgi:hypothetical protein
MNALTKPHGSCRGPSGSDMHMQTKPNWKLWQTFCSRMPGNWQLSCGFVMIIVQGWMGVIPAGIEWTTPLSAGSEHYFGHASLWMLLWVFPPDPVARPKWPTTSM